MYSALRVRRLNQHPSQPRLRPNGDTIKQARRFFENVRVDEFLVLEEKGWIIEPNLHFAFMAKHLCWAKGTTVSNRDYFEYWHGEGEIGQIQRDPAGFKALFQQLQEDGTSRARSPSYSRLPRPRSSA